MQSLIALSLLKAETTKVVVSAQTLPIFLKIAQNKGHCESVSNVYLQFMHNQPHFGLKMYYFITAHLSSTP